MCQAPLSWALGKHQRAQQAKCMPARDLHSGKENRPYTYKQPFALLSAGIECSQEMKQRKGSELRSRKVFNSEQGGLRGSDMEWET